jgi:UDP-GlcNAc:undecaprenyl-phosphate GlcNAc-1-phosphate transferase
MSFPDAWRALIGDGDALWAFLCAAGIVLALTPLVVRLAPWIGAVDRGGDRPRVHSGPIPRIGGLAIVAGILVPTVVFVDLDGPYVGMLVGTVLVALLGLVDDVRGIGPGTKFLAVCAIALIPVVGYGMTLESFSLPLVGSHELGWAAYPITILWVAALANLVNLIDGMDALAAGIVSIAAFSFALLAASFGRSDEAIIAAAICGATIALVAPLLVLAVPILDTSFVVLKRLKYGRNPFAADQNHFYHRFLRIGFSQRRTAAYLHGWAVLLAVWAILLRFVPPRPHGQWELGNALVVGLVGLVVVATSVWMVYSLEILKARHLRVFRLGRNEVEEGEASREKPVGRALSGTRGRS